MKADVDPQFVDYVVERPRLSYIQPTDSKVRKLVINLMEMALGRHKLESVYWSLKDQPFDVRTFFANALHAGKFQVKHHGKLPETIAVEGPLVMLANHPFGIVDGLVFCDIATQLRGDFRILINSVLCQDSDLAPYFLPVDFENTKRAVKTNIRTKQLALEAISNNIPLLIFPSGMVSTARKFGFGKVYDGPWTTFAAKLIKQSRATVLPIHFHGRNSRKFHVASHLAEALRMGLLMHEAVNKFGGEVQVSIGEAIAWSELELISDRKQLTQELYSRVQSLSSKAGEKKDRP